MKEVMLWRHAKAALASALVNDSERPLNRRGERAADAVARWLAHRRLLPDTILCSPALRTRQTAARLAAHFGALPTIAYERGLYLASPGTLLTRLQALPADTGRCLLIGHNDGIWQLARMLAELGPADQRASLGEKFPTGALAWIRLPIERWDQAGAEPGELLHFVRPRDIVDAPG